MKYMFGNLITMGINGTFDCIVHGCNLYNTMGGGIAAEVNKRLNEAYQADLKTVKGDRKKLGTYTFAVIDGLTVINAYTQATFWDPSDMLDYDAVDKVMAKIAVDFPNKRIGMPLIGAGLAGGKWSKLLPIIEKYLPDAFIVVFNQNDYMKIVEPTFRKDVDIFIH